MVLASSSPRRREILASLGLAFEILVPELDESGRDHFPVEERVLALAEDKARAAAALLPLDRECMILAADTLVRVREGFAGEGSILGKPASRDEAAAMIRSLAGVSHDVYTGLALLSLHSGRMDRIRSDSRVRFAPMDEAEIEAYLDSDDWRGVAGAYKIQGRAALYIESIEGSWSGIVGLPLRELYVILNRAGFPLSRLGGERGADGDIPRDAWRPAAPCASPLVKAPGDIPSPARGR